MQISAADLASVVVGSLFVAIGIVAVAVAFSSRPRINRSAAWFGAFCVLYGLRLVADASGALGWLVLTRARDQEASYVALSHELELARSIQQSLLPQRMPEMPGLRLQATYLPMSAVAGDLYEILTLSEGRVLILVADVSGHGVPAALIASMLKIAVAPETDRYDAPGEILTGINRALTGKFEAAYVTACCVIVDPMRRRIAYAAAGHPPPLLRRADGRIEKLENGGVWLTMMSSTSYNSTSVDFGPGDRLLMDTDGLTATRRADGDEFFGDTELTRVFTSLSPSDDVMKEVLEARQRWAGPEASLSDDISVVVIERTGAIQPEGLPLRQ